MSKRKGAEPVEIDDQIADYKAAFEFYGAEKDVLKKDDLRSIMQKMNIPVNNDTLQKMISDGGDSSGKEIDFTQFMTMMNKKMKDMGQEDKLRADFEVFDPKGTGFVDADDLYQKLTTMGDKLTSAEMEEVNKVALKDGKFDYNALMKEMFGSKATTTGGQ